MGIEDSRFRGSDGLRRFTFKGRLGHGGMGEVWEIAFQGRPNALKILLPQLIAHKGLARRMVDEGEALVQLKHPNLVEVHEVGVTERDGSGERGVWIRMELVRGMTLRQKLHRHRRLSLALACAYMRSAGHGAHVGHSIGAVHRDIKPENFMVTPAEEVKLLDFGLAKFYGSPDTQNDSSSFGTPLYMAPEQFRRQERTTPATDVYALGLTTYEVLTGEHPFGPGDGEAANVFQLAYEHLDTVPPPLTDFGVPPEVAAVVAKAIEKDPRARHQNGLAFAEALWAAWTAVNARDPEAADTRPGEPPVVRLLARPDDGRRFGTGPEGPKKPKAETPSGPVRVDRVSRPIERALTERLPRAMGDDQALRAYVAERSAAQAAGRGQTLRMPIAQRDPSCVRALDGAPPTPAPGGPWVPVAHTQPMAIHPQAASPAPRSVAPPSSPPRPSEPPPPPREGRETAGTSGHAARSRSERRPAELRGAEVEERSSRMGMVLERRVTRFALTWLFPILALLLGAAVWQRLRAPAATPSVEVGAAPSSIAPPPPAVAASVAAAPSEPALADVPPATAPTGAATVTARLAVSTALAPSPRRTAPARRPNPAPPSSAASDVVPAMAPAPALPPVPVPATAAAPVPAPATAAAPVPAPAPPAPRLQMIYERHKVPIEAPQAPDAAPAGQDPPRP